MKYYILFVIFFITSFLYSQNISDVSISGDRMSVRNSMSREISYKYLSKSEKLVGFSSTIIVIQNGDRVIVLNENLKELSYRYLQKGEEVKSVTSNIIIKSNSSRISTYDRNFKLIGYTYY